VKALRQSVCEVPLGPQGSRLRLVLEQDDQEVPVTPIRQQGGDIFFVTPDCRIVAVVVRMTTQAAVA
jgi:hypothetical protein